MIDDHAKVRIEGRLIPLLGIPRDAMIQECDCCHDEFPLQDIEFVRAQWLCPKC